MAPPEIITLDSDSDDDVPVAKVIDLTTPEPPDRIPRPGRRGLQPNPGGVVRGPLPSETTRQSQTNPTSAASPPPAKFSPQSASRAQSNSAQDLPKELVVQSPLSRAFQEAGYQAPDDEDWPDLGVVQSPLTRAFREAGHRAVDDEDRPDLGNEKSNDGDEDEPRNKDEMQLDDEPQLENQPQVRYEPQIGRDEQVETEDEAELGKDNDSPSKSGPNSDKSFERSIGTDSPIAVRHRQKKARLPESNNRSEGDKSPRHIIAQRRTSIEQDFDSEQPSSFDLGATLETFRQRVDSDFAETVALLLADNRKEAAKAKPVVVDKLCPWASMKGINLEPIHSSQPLPEGKSLVKLDTIVSCLYL